MKEKLAADARALIASARALVEELEEEGIDQYERPDPETVAVPAPDRSPAPLSEPVVTREETAEAFRLEPVAEPADAGLFVGDVLGG